MVHDVLVHGSTLGNPTMRHEVPARVLDPFLYGEHGGRAFAVLSMIDARMAVEARPGLEVLDPFELGLLTLVERGMDRESASDEISVRAVQRMGIVSAVVPRDFPLALADRLAGRASSWPSMAVVRWPAAGQHLCRVVGGAPGVRRGGRRDGRGGRSARAMLGRFGRDGDHRRRWDADE